MGTQSKVLTPEIEKFVCDHWKSYMDKELHEKILVKFGVNVNPTVIKYLRRRRRWVSENAGAKGKRAGKCEVLLPNAAKSMIAWLCTIMTDRELAELINEKFGRSIKDYQISRWRKNNKIRCGRDSKFKVGMKPTAGVIKKGEHRSRATEFKKGNDNGCSLPVGTEICTMGYWKRKIANPNKWMWRSRWIWEQANPPLKPGEVLIHIDGNTENDSLENLRLTTRNVLGRINTGGRFHNRRIEKDQVDWNKSCILIAEIEQKIVEALRGVYQ